MSNAGSNGLALVEAPPSIRTVYSEGREHAHKAFSHGSQKEKDMKVLNRFTYEATWKELGCRKGIRRNPLYIKTRSQIIWCV